MRILAVDDDIFVLAILQEALRAGGYTDALFLSSPKDALDAIEKAPAPFQCFLLDIEMPGMSGIELCREIRQSPVYRQTPIVMVTAKSDRPSIDAAFSAGATDYVNKPIDPIEVITRVRTAEALLEKDQKLAETVHRADIDRARVETVLHFAIEEPVTILDVERVISKLSMENYLLKLSRFQMFGSALTAIGIAEFDEIFARTDCTETYDILTDFADALSMSLKHTESMICYQGFGEFLCVTSRRDHVDSEQLAFSVNDRISDFDLVYETGAPCHATAIAGETVLPSLWAAGHPLELADMALAELAQARREWYTSRSGFLSKRDAPLPRFG